MCRSSAAATSKDGQKAISKGVLVLVVPPIGFMTLGVGLAFRRIDRAAWEAALEQARRDPRSSPSDHD